MKFRGFSVHERAGYENLFLLSGKDLRRRLQAKLFSLPSFQVVWHFSVPSEIFSELLEFSVKRKHKKATKQAEKKRQQMKNDGENFQLNSQLDRCEFVVFIA